MSITASIEKRYPRTVTIIRKVNRLIEPKILTKLRR